MNRNNNRIPNHVAIIQDGNRRYAYENDKSAYKGHREGVKSTERIVELCGEVGIKHLTVYALSTENLNRDEEELSNLFDLFTDKLKEATTDERIKDNEIKIRIIGRKDFLPGELLDAIKRVEEETKSYEGFYFNVAIGYGGRREIVDATKKLAEKVRQGVIKPSDINQDIFSKHLYPSSERDVSLPDVDLLVRTGGENRISNFLLWQICGGSTVFYSSDVFWPDFNKKEFNKALKAYKEIN